jgi:cell wall-associated NlpC family hydrolase
MSVSGLSPANARKAINDTLQAAVLGLHHASVIHYTQDERRWQGIDRHRVAAKGEFPSYADCSSYVTWCLWNGLKVHLDHSDTVNGQRWMAGYTGTLLGHGKEVGSPGPGDLIIYGDGFPGKHTTIYTGGGLVVSHGSEAGPMLLPWRYREDVMQVRRYI